MFLFYMLWRGVLNWVFEYKHVSIVNKIEQNASHSVSYTLCCMRFSPTAEIITRHSTAPEQSEIHTWRKTLIQRTYKYTIKNMSALNAAPVGVGAKGTTRITLSNKHTHV